MKDKIDGIKDFNKTSDKELFESFFNIGEINTKEADLETLFKWKTKVWDKCLDKKEKDTADGITYSCKLNKKNCDFKNCPKK